MPLTRLFAVLAGILILACATWAVIDSAKLGGAHAALVCSLAVGTSVGAFVMARSHWLAGMMIALAVICGEGYGMLMTAERIVAMREASQSPARLMADAQAKARDRLKAAEAALAAAPVTSLRIATATAAKGDADRAAIAKAAEKSCSENCRKLLEAAVASSKAELDDARREITAERSRLAAAIDAERTMLAGLQMPSTGTALADRLGLAPWLLDLMAACLLTLGANGLAAVLIAWGSHVARPDRTGALTGAPAPFAAPTGALALVDSGPQFPGPQIRLAAEPRAQPDPVATPAPVPEAAPGPVETAVPVAPVVPPPVKHREPEVRTPAPAAAVPVPAAAQPVAIQPVAIQPAPAAAAQPEPAAAPAVPAAVPSTIPAAVPAAAPAATVTPLVVGSIARFLLQGVAPSEGSRVEMVELFAGYRRWCHASGLAPVGAERFAGQLADVCAKAGITTRRARGHVFIMDVSLAQTLRASG